MVSDQSPFPDADTPVVVVGGTGRYGQAQIAGMLAAGTRIVASVAPGRGAASIDGIPTFDTVAEAVATRGAQAAVIYTPPAGVRDAVVECAEAGIRFAVTAAEFVPIHDTMSALAKARVHDMWVVGPNTLGFAIPGQILLDPARSHRARSGRAVRPQRDAAGDDRAAAHGARHRPEPGGSHRRRHAVRPQPARISAGRGG